VTLTELLSRVSIVAVYLALGGELRNGRGRAFWRNGDGSNVPLDEKTGTWFDFARGEGGGILDLIQSALGCTRREAVEWLASFAGVTLGGAQPSREDVRRAAADREHAEMWAHGAERRLLTLRERLTGELHLAMEREATEAELDEIGARLQSLNRKLTELRQAGRRPADLAQLWRAAIEADAQRAAVIEAEGREDIEHAEWCALAAVQALIAAGSPEMAVAA
jgi:hypothetical protein